jgi:DNA-binding MarR family transcriptional regulator
VSGRLEQLLGATAVAAVDRLRAAVAGTDLDETEAGALVHLQAWPGTSVNELAGVVGRSQPATVRLVDRLEAAGLLRRQGGRDRRTVALVLTEAGLQRVDEALHARTGALQPLIAALSAGERTALEGILTRLVASVADDRQQALHLCRLCDRDACSSGPGCPLGHTTLPDAPAFTSRRR